MDFYKDAARSYNETACQREYLAMMKDYKTELSMAAWRAIHAYIELEKQLETKKEIT